VHIDAHAARPNGKAITGVTCSWTLDNDATPVSTSCLDDISVPAGTHTLHVTATDPATGCNVTSASASFTAASPVTAAATLTPQCGHQFGYSGSGTGSGALTFSWTFSGPGTSNPATSTQQSGNVTTSSAGTYSAHLTVTDARGCSGSNDQTVDVADDLAPTLTLTRDCNLSFTYSVNVTGGTGSKTFAWSFTPPAGATVTPSTLTGSSGSASVSAPGDYGASVTITDARGCQASPSGTTHPFAPLQVGLQALSAPPACISNSSAVTFQASVSGGSGTGATVWSGAACSGLSCLVDSANDCANLPISVSVNDSICGTASSPTLTYHKLTTVSVTP